MSVLPIAWITSPPANNASSLPAIHLTRHNHLSEQAEDLPLFRKSIFLFLGKNLLIIDTDNIDTPRTWNKLHLGIRTKSTLQFSLQPGGSG